MKEDFKKRLNQALSLRNMKPSELAEKSGMHKSRISQYTNGLYEAKQDAVYKLAKALDVNEAWLMGFDVPIERIEYRNYPTNLYKIETKKLPILGSIAAGQPITANQELEHYVEVGTNVKADFCLKVKGDSMINARIQDGDIVFIRQQPTVEEGQIAAVLIDEEATLKRVYTANGEIILMAENPNYKPLIYKPEDGKNIRIIGKAVAFQSDVI